MVRACCVWHGALPISPARLQPVGAAFPQPWLELSSWTRDLQLGPRSVPWLSRALEKAATRLL